MEKNCYCCKKIVYLCDCCGKNAGYSLKKEGKFCSKICEKKGAKKILKKESKIFCGDLACSLEYNLMFCIQKISLLRDFKKDFFNYKFEKDVLQNYGTNSYYFKKNHNIFRFSDHFSKHEILRTFFDYKHQDFYFKICEVSFYDATLYEFVSQNRFDFVIPNLTLDNIETKILEIKDFFKKENLIINN
jgi:hypothetical protein